VISIRRVSLGGGYRYLMESVAAGDGAKEPSSPLARYYVESGTPPGIFLGKGLADLDGGRGVTSGSQVTEEHLRLMLAGCADPVSGESVGAMPMSSGSRVPVAGFDLTFSPCKSVSVAWALADEETKGVIFDCHRRAIDYVLAYGEEHVFCSRSGKNGVVEEDVTGVIAAAFTHFASRADDPQLHDHVIIWNRAKSVSDHKWRTLDSRSIFKATTTLSELHHGVLSDLLTEALGLGWEARERRHSAKPRHEITGVEERLMAEFSQRAEQIAVHSDTLRVEFASAHGRSATAVEDMRLHQVATLATRPKKTHGSLAELTGTWRERADGHVAVEEQLAWVRGLAGRNDLPLLSACDLGEPILADAARAVVAAVAEHHSTYGRLNLLAEAHRMLHGVRFSSPDERVAVAETVTDLAVAGSLVLTPPSLHYTPQPYLRPDGTSRLRPRGHVLYTTASLLEAEGRLLAAGRDDGGPRVGVGRVAKLAGANLPGRDYGLSLDQAVAVEKIATSGLVLDALVGPAGTGKSTTMAGLRSVWEQEHGKGSVIGLAPSAAAAEVLAAELGIGTENTARWLTEWRRIPELTARRDRLAANLARHAYAQSADCQKLRARLDAAKHAVAERRLRPGQLVVIDEASLCGTLALDEIVTAAKSAGAKVLLSGDWAQISGVEAGGAFALLVGDRGELVAELTDVRRFSSDWEKTASVELRLGQQGASEKYEAHGRIEGGDRESLLDAMYAAWTKDVENGRSSLMIAADSATAAELNARARADRVRAGTVADDGVLIADGQRAGVGDEVVTRQNNRLLRTAKSFVKNGDRWVVTATNADASMALRRPCGGGEVVLPADYVAGHVDLAYASTAYRCQGRTTDTSHFMVTPTTSREVLYVSATRGRESNRLYVDVSYDPDPESGHDGPAPPQSTRDVLAGVLANDRADLSAHETLRQEQSKTEDLATLAAEYDTLARAAQAQRWDELLKASGLDLAQLEQVRRSEAHGPLVAALRDAEARGLDVEAVFPKLVASRSLDGADDPASVMHSRVDRWARAATPSRRAASNLIAGLIPRALNVTDPGMARALRERDVAMQARARELAAEALEAGQPWTRVFGPPPTDAARRQQWIEAISTVAAYRHRWNIGNDDRPLGSDPDIAITDFIDDRKRAAVASERVLRLSDKEPKGSRPRLSTGSPELERSIPAGVDL
jgi:conjugative relaxase-like TrwC/TraI family protein